MTTPGSVKTDRLSDKDAKEENEDQSSSGESSTPQPLTHISYKWDARHALTLMYVLLDPSPFSNNVAHSSIESFVWAVSARFRKYLTQG